MSHDDLDHIPPIVPSRDAGPERGTRRVTGERRRSPAGTQRAPSAGGSGTLFRMVAGIALIAAGLACAWAWQLQNKLNRAESQLQDYAARIGDLEARLSDTDEGVNQNAAVQAVKLAELEGEVRKLWDNVWKETKDRLSRLEAASTAQGKNIKDMESSVASNRSALQEANADLAELKSIGGDLARLMASAKAGQAEVERVADSLNRIELSLAKMEKRVAGNEEWVASVDAFRRQVNASLGELQTAVRALQTGP